jgi:hypothetical protein
MQAKTFITLVAALLQQITSNEPKSKRNVLVFVGKNLEMGDN